MTTTKSRLPVHVASHKTCDICGEMFGGIRAKRLLESHKKKHEETYFECEKCKKKFAYKSRLVAHMKTKKCRPIM